MEIIQQTGLKKSNNQEWRIFITNKMTNLPKMGRPSVSGLSVKELGLAEYTRRYYELHHTPKTDQRWWTGLHSSKMTHAGYMAAWRALIKMIYEN